MKCNEARKHWNLYHDSEGDSGLLFAINEHLGMCPGCAEWFSQQSRLEELLKEKLNHTSPSPAMWQRVFAKSGLVRPVRSKRWLLLSGLAACLALAAGLMMWNGGRGRDGPNLPELTAAWHERIVTGKEAPAFVSQSDLEVEGYLRRKVDFPVRCPPRQDTGFVVKGAGTFKFDEEPAAYLVGHVDEVPVTIIILSRESLPKFPWQADALRLQKAHLCRQGAYEVALAVIDRNAVLVIGRLQTEKIVRVLKGYGTYPDHVPG